MSSCPAKRNDERRRWSLVVCHSSLRNALPMRPSLRQSMSLALLLTIILLAPVLPVARQAWQWNALSLATLRWYMTSDTSQARHWEAETARRAAAVNVTSMASPRQRERLQHLWEQLDNRVRGESGLQAVDRVVADLGSGPIPEAELRALLEQLSSTQPMFLMGTVSEAENQIERPEVAPGWRLLGFDLASHRLRPGPQERVLLYWERDSEVSASSGSMQVGDWSLLWSSRRVYQYGTITKLISQVGVVRSLGGDSTRVLTGHLIPVDKEGRYLFSIRMQVRGDPETRGCIRAYIRGSDGGAVDPHFFCSSDPEWTQLTFVISVQPWMHQLPGQWVEMMPFVQGPPFEMQYDNALLFPLDTGVLAAVPSR